MGIYIYIYIYAMLYIYICIVIYIYIYIYYRERESGRYYLSVRCCALYLENIYVGVGVDSMQSADVLHPGDTQRQRYIVWAHACVCVCVWLHISLSIYYINIRVCKCIHIYVDIYIYTYMGCMHVCWWQCHLKGCLSICLSEMAQETLYVYICIYIYINTYIYIYSPYVAYTYIEM